MEISTGSETQTLCWISNWSSSQKEEEDEEMDGKGEGRERGRRRNRERERERGGGGHSCVFNRTLNNYPSVLFPFSPYPKKD